jgi:photosystem II stability/assembly factor-like uncharacterized protein
MHFRLFVILSLISFVTISDLSGQTVDPETLKKIEFRDVGPTRGGRATTVAGVIQERGTFYMGATGGGVWKTEDYGNSWENISDGYFASPSIGAIRVAPSNPKKVYVGTGSDGLRSNIIAGKGMYRSDDAGKTWKTIGLEKTGHIGAVEVHPENPELLYVAAIGNAFEPNPERGIYRSKNGGEAWEQVLFLSDTVGFADLELAPDDPNTLYAAAWRAERKPWTIISGGEAGGIYKSVDGGDTWKQVMSSAGMASKLIGKIDLAVSADDPSRVYALVEAPEGEGGLYRSDDKGETWKLVSAFDPLLDRPFYYCNVDANPLNADAVYVNTTQFWYSSKAGDGWKRMRTPHGDNHDMWINPQDSLLWIQANDGGVNVTLDGGNSWSTQNNQPTAELYQVEVDTRTPYWLYAGQQDNSTIAVPSTQPYNAAAGPMAFWEAVGGCETGPAVPKPGDPNIVYSNCKGRFSVYDRRTGQSKQYYVGAANIYGHNPKDLTYRFQRVSPIHVSPHDPDVVYHTSQFVHRTTDDGLHWETISPDLTAFESDKQVISGSPITRDVTGEEYYSTIYAIRESSVEAGQIWVGANDGPVHITRDNGKSWKNVTPADLPGGGRIDCVEPSPHRAEKAYFTSLRYQLGDWKPYLYRTNDYGATWELLSTEASGFPMDQPVRVVREDPKNEGLLYAGTEYGLWISFDDGAHWQSFQQNVPVTPITDMKVFRDNLLLSTMGRGFWVLDDLPTLRQLPALAKADSPKILPIGKVQRIHSYPERGVPEYPVTGVKFFYYLPEKANAPLSLDIMNAGGEVIRSFTSVSKADRDKMPSEPDMATGFVQRGYSGALSGKAGLHEFQWDFRHDGAWTESGSSRRGSPMAAPGNYRIRLQIGDKKLEELFVLEMDPRVSESGVTVEDLKAQEALALQVRNLMSRANQLDAAVKKALKKEEDNKVLKALDAGLNTAGGRYQVPQLLDQISYLSSMLSYADQRPGQDAYDRYEELRKWFEDALEDWVGISGESAEMYKLDDD